MTLAAGDRGLRAPPAGPVRRGGFTIVELLVVIGILALLAAMVLVAFSGTRAKANREASKAMIERLRDSLEEFRRLKGSYPLDGYDSEVKTKDGQPIWGSACLYEFLGKEFVVEENVAGQIRRMKHEPLMAFQTSELTPEGAESPEVREVLDGFGIPLHYDNTENGVFAPQAQGEAAHMDTVKDHPPDPRDDPRVVQRRGIQRQGAYDLWSHGFSGAHNPRPDPSADIEMTIGTWNLHAEKAETARKAGT